MVLCGTKKLLFYGIAVKNLLKKPLWCWSNINILPYCQGQYFCNYSKVEANVLFEVPGCSRAYFSVLEVSAGEKIQRCDLGMEP